MSTDREIVTLARDDLNRAIARLRDEIEHADPRLNLLLRYAVRNTEQARGAVTALVLALDALDALAAQEAGE